MDKATYQNKSLSGINVPEDKNPAWLGSLSAGGYGRKSKNLRWHMLNWKKETERTNSLEGRICLSKLTHGDLLPSAKLHNPNLSDQIALSTGHQLFKCLRLWGIFLSQVPKAHLLMIGLNMIFCLFVYFKK